MESSSLSNAIRDRDCDKVKKLLTSGQCSPNGDGSERYPPIIECIISATSDKDDADSCELLKLLVLHGADLNVRSESNGFCDVDYTGITPAMSAALRGNLTCLRFLVESGADLDIVSEDGDTTLTIAVKEAHVDCVRFLAQYLPPSVLNERDDYGMTALMWAASSHGEHHILCMQHLIAAGAKVGVEADDGDTALMIAVRSGNAPAVKLLLEKGALVNSITDYGETPLTSALHSANCSIILTLLRHGADPTKSRRHLSCIQEMVSCQQNSIVRALVMNGFPPLDMAFVVRKYPFHAGKIRQKLKSYIETTRVSPLAVALLYSHTDVALYFIANQFFTRFDIVRLCWDPVLRQLLQDMGASKSLEILDFQATRPKPLFQLCSVVVTSILTQDLVRQPVRGCDTEGAANPWVYSPTFREKLGRLDLPLVLQKVLLHKTPSSGICCQTWSGLPFGEIELSPACHCVDCEGLEMKT
ncbi:hypothetical protein RRG08_049583 [Elysia crispata]|uniref:Uncharacterized protein n=1 Tax=Elysia crispata TaxID=231223 RepID=A0AAE1AUI5_9GAST|nr:hypothetical protein RRG08_049583 [Elysia crispata]